MSDVIYTVETGEYSAHTIHGFCTTLEEASRVAQQWLDSTGYEDEPRPNDCHSWPFVYENPTNTLVGYNQAKRVRWCAADNFEQPEVPK